MPKVVHRLEGMRVERHIVRTMVLLTFSEILDFSLLADVDDS
jgi:hypothetical protein